MDDLTAEVTDNLTDLTNEITDHTNKFSFFINDLTVKVAESMQTTLLVTDHTNRVT
jgi:hypothetical protein